MRGGILGANRSEWENKKGRFANDEQENNEKENKTGDSLQSNSLPKTRKLKPLKRPR